MQKEKAFCSHISDWELVSRACEELTTQKTDNQI